MYIAWKNQYYLGFLVSYRCPAEKKLICVPCFFLFKQFMLYLGANLKASRCEKLAILRQDAQCAKSSSEAQKQPGRLSNARCAQNQPARCTGDHFVWIACLMNDVIVYHLWQLILSCVWELHRLFTCSYCVKCACNCLTDNICICPSDDNENNIKTILKFFNTLVLPMKILKEVASHNP